MKLMTNFMVSWGLIFISSICDVLTMIFIKKRYVQTRNIPLDSLTAFLKWLFNFFNSPLSIVFLLLFFAAPLFWFFALNKINLSAGYPVGIGFRLILIMVLSFLLLGEAINLQKALAIVLLIISLYLLYR